MFSYSLVFLVANIFLVLGSIALNALKVEEQVNLKV